MIQWLAAVLKDDDIGTALEEALAKVTNTYFVTARQWLLLLWKTWAINILVYQSRLPCRKMWPWFSKPTFGVQMQAWDLHSWHTSHLKKKIRKGNVKFVASNLTVSILAKVVSCHKILHSPLPPVWVFFLWPKNCFMTNKCQLTRLFKNWNHLVGGGNLFRGLRRVHVCDFRSLVIFCSWTEYSLFTSYTLKSQKRMAEVLCFEHYFRFPPRQGIWKNAANSIGTIDNIPILINEKKIR